MHPAPTPGFFSKVVDNLLHCRRWATVESESHVEEVELWAATIGSASARHTQELYTCSRSSNRIMVAVTSGSMANDTNAVSRQSTSRSIPSTKKSKKAPKKEHKAKREKMKRDHLNELFVDLDQALEPNRQNNGKASILVDTTRLLRDLVGQVEALRKENVTLMNESQYVTDEKIELQEEKNALQAEVERLQNELHDRMHSDPVGELHSKADLASSMLPHSFATAMPLPQQQLAAPFYDIALHQDLNSLPEDGASRPSTKVPSTVSRPHARYPTSADAWSLELLSRNQRAAHEAQYSNSASGSGDEGLDNA